LNLEAVPDYSASPLYVYWEMTQVCGLACRHCRATSKRVPHPDELSTGEGRALLAQVASFGPKPPTMIFSGGDPLSRPDLFELMDEAHRLGIPTAVTPSATPTLRREHFEQLKAHNVAAISMSLDGSNAALHDGIRNIPGTFDTTLRAWEWIRELELPLLVNTLVSKATGDDLPAVYELLKRYPVTRWSLFFLIAVGRGRFLAPLDNERAERVMRWMYERSLEAPFLIGSTEAPSYRRIAIEAMQAAGAAEDSIRQSSVFGGAAVRDGNGVVFIAKTGDVYPTGFLPLSGGNVRERSLVDIYRSSELFSSLHDPAQLKGKCGACSYRFVCGGSRARAYASTGDPLEADPICLYQPATVAA
jgi:radical SAM protein